MGNGSDKLVAVVIVVVSNAFEFVAVVVTGIVVVVSASVYGFVVVPLETSHKESIAA